MHKIGKITIPSNVSAWPHEEKVAKIIASYGHEVIFLKKKEGHKVHSPDFLIDGIKWELKSPRADKLATIHRNLMRAKNQSPNIIISSLRIKNIPDIAIEREIRSQSTKISGVKHIKFVNRKNQIIDIK